MGHGKHSRRRQRASFSSLSARTIPRKLHYVLAQSEARDSLVFAKATAVRSAVALDLKKKADATKVAPAASCLTLDYGFLVLSAAAESAFRAVLSVAGAAAGATAGAALSAAGASLAEEPHAARNNTAAAKAGRFIFNVLQGSE